MENNMKIKEISGISRKRLILLGTLCLSALFLLWLFEPILTLNQPRSSSPDFPEPDRNPIVSTSIKVLTVESNPAWQSISVAKPSLPVEYKNEPIQKQSFSFFNAEDCMGFINLSISRIVMLPVGLCMQVANLISPPESIDPVKQVIEKRSLSPKTLKYFPIGDRAVLLRHLATSCKWFLTKTNAGIEAILRHDTVTPNSGPAANSGGTSNNKPDDHWTSELNGWLPDSEMSEIVDPGSQHRVMILPDGQTSIAGTLGYPFSTKPGQAAIVVEPPSDERAQEVLDELQSLAKSKTAVEQGFDPELMPKFSIRSGKPELRVWSYHSGSFGCYSLDAFVNPAEPGFAYLAVFDAVKNTPLRIQSPERTIEYIGWSNKPEETFFYNTIVYLESGDSTYEYPARFELWFKPDDAKKPERKLVEAVYKVSGPS
jgi:hypothetical protein